MSQFDACMTFTLEQEGGYSDTPGDSGGATNFGITQSTLASWRGHVVSAADVQALSSGEAGQIYKARYWDVVKGDSLPPGVDLMVFDFGVNAGPGASAKVLQICLEIDADGQIGPITLAAVAADDPHLLIGLLGVAQNNFYQHVVDQNVTDVQFLKGWLGRTERRIALAQQMAGT